MHCSIFFLKKKLITSLINAKAATLFCSKYAIKHKILADQQNFILFDMNS